MSKSDLDERLAVATRIAREAGDLALAAFQNRTGPVHKFKGQHDYLTETDSAVEKLLRDKIAARFPGDSFLGEESVGDDASQTFGRDIWVVDPIDGTANFARGVPHFCISIAFVRDGKTEIGVINDPVKDEMYVARRGGGARRNGDPIRVSGITAMSEAIVEAGWSMRRPTDSYIALVDRIYKAGGQVRRAGSGALGLAYVADGRSDGYCELHINSWDALAGLVLISEAGGWACDLLANGGLLRGNPVLGCTPALKDELTRIMELSS